MPGEIKKCVITKFADLSGYDDDLSFDLVGLITSKLDFDFSMPTATPNSLSTNIRWFSICSTSLMMKVY